MSQESQHLPTQYLSLELFMCSPSSPPATVFCPLQHNGESTHFTECVIYFRIAFILFPVTYFPIAASYCFSPGLLQGLVKLLLSHSLQSLPNYLSAFLSVCLSLSSCIFLTHAELDHQSPVTQELSMSHYTGKPQTHCMTSLQSVQ